MQHDTASPRYADLVQDERQYANVIRLAFATELERRMTRERR